MEGENTSRKPRIQVEEMGVWAGKGSWNGKWRTESRLEKVGKDLPGPSSGEVAGKKCQKRTGGIRRN